MFLHIPYFQKVDVQGFKTRELWLLLAISASLIKPIPDNEPAEVTTPDGIIRDPVYTIKLIFHILSVKFNLKNHVTMWTKGPFK